MEFAQMSQKRRMVEGKTLERNPEVPDSNESLEDESVIEESTAVEVRKMTTTLIHQYGSPRSPNDEYKILKFLGEGSFGKVAKCLKKGSNETVAVKICKFPSITTYMNETLILRKLSLDDPDKFNVVRSVENFGYKNHFFLVFEMLEKSILQYMEEDRHRPLPMDGIRYVTEQLLTAQNKLRDLRIIHGDLKPENIMLVNHKHQPFRIKIIDFGSSIQLPTSRYPLKLGTITYRAPEITLGKHYNEAVDMWSTGCLVAEMLTGEVLYPSLSPYEQIRFIDEAQGPFPEHMLNSNKVASEYFCCEKVMFNNQRKWRVKTPREYMLATGNNPSDYRKYHLKNLDSLLLICSRVRRGYIEEHRDRKYCVDMIKRMLQINHNSRIFPGDALGSNFICGGKKSNWQSYQ